MHLFFFFCLLKIDIIIMCCLNFKTWIWSPFPLYSIFGLNLFECEKDVNLLQSNFLFFEFGVPFLLYSIFGLQLYDCENNIITLISFRAIFFSNLIYHVALINWPLEWLSVNASFCKSLHFNLCNVFEFIKSPKKKIKLKKKKTNFMKMQNLK